MQVVGRICSPMAGIKRIKSLIYIRHYKQFSLDLKMLSRVLISATLVLNACTVGAFPAYGSLAGLTRDQLDAIVPTLTYQTPENPPGPLQDTSAKLVNDAAHPWKPQAPGDIRGPCPGLNTLASHGVSSFSNFYLTSNRNKY